MQFGYTKNLRGNPVPFKVALLRNWEVVDDQYPLLQLRQLTEAEETMSLNQLQARYPYVGEPDDSAV